MQKIENMLNERSFAERDFQVLTTCGKKATVVHAPAINPNVCVSICLNTRQS